MSNSAHDVIESLGGYREVANLLGLKPNVTWNWTKRPGGIPWMWRPTLADLLLRNGKAVPANFLRPVRDAA